MFHRVYTIPNILKYIFDFIHPHIHSDTCKYSPLVSDVNAEIV